MSVSNRISRRLSSIVALFSVAALAGLMTLATMGCDGAASDDVQAPIDGGGTGVSTKPPGSPSTPPAAIDAGTGGTTTVPSTPDAGTVAVDAGNATPPIAVPPTTPPPATTPPTTVPPATPPPTTTPPATIPPVAGNAIKHVFVITMENEAAAAIYGSSHAPYLNGLLPKYARANAFADPLPDSVPSEPHYVWMEAGTNAFSDHTFTTDSDPSASNSTTSTAHIAAQMQAASPPVSWLSFQEGLNSATGACPVHSSGLYAAKHDPFIFFRDIAGSPPSATNALCVAHHRAYTTASFAQSLSSGDVAQYNFITPNVCNDMHGDSACPSSDGIAMGDAWLASNLPPLIDYVNANAGVIFIVWDEPVGGSTLIPFIAIGPHVKPGYAGTVAYNHGSLTKSVEEILTLPVLPTAAAANDFQDLFQPGFFP